MHAHKQSNNSENKELHMKVNIENSEETSLELPLFMVKGRGPNGVFFSTLKRTNVLSNI